jgi:hypothetical protein
MDDLKDIFTNSYISFKDIFCVELQEALGGQLVFYS